MRTLIEIYIQMYNYIPKKAIVECEFFKIRKASGWTDPFYLYPARLIK